jgi:ornithine cyclodeaminase
MDGRWLGEADVVGLLGLPDAISVVGDALRQEAAGRARTMAKSHIAWGDGHTLHAVGGVVGDVVGTKTWAHTAGGAAPLLVLWDATSGDLMAVVEAFALGQLRTAAVSGVATDALAAPDADELAILGSGRQAHAQVAAVDAVRPLRRIRVWSPTPAHADAFAARLRGAGAGDVTVAPTPAAAVAGASVVTTATRARAPIVTASMLASGVHVNAVGAITPERAEIDADVLARCAVVAADDPDAARRLARELSADTAVTALSTIVAGGAGRAEGADVTLFRAMGIGVADVALGAELVRRGAASDAGQPLPPPGPAPLDLPLGRSHA